jgi:hypothetical protein
MKHVPMNPWPHGIADFVTAASQCDFRWWRRNAIGLISNSPKTGTPGWVNISMISYNNQRPPFEFSPVPDPDPHKPHEGGGGGGSIKPECVHLQEPTSTPNQPLPPSRSPSLHQWTRTIDMKGAVTVTGSLQMSVTRRECPKTLPRPTKRQ